MQYRKLRRLLCGCLAQLLLVTGACAAAGEPAGSQPEWQSWLVSQVNMHPDIIAAREAVNATLSTADQLDRPIYNPDLLGGYEREGDANNWRVGLGQTFDVNRRRSAQEQQALALRDSALQTYEAAWQKQAATVLAAMVTRQAARERYKLALEQQTQLDDLIDLMRLRQAAGDLGQIDVEMTLLSLSQRLNDTALSLAAFQQAEAALQELVPEWQPASTEVPGTFWSIPVVTPPEDWLLNHPRSLAAQANWQALDKQAVVADRQRKSEPTLVLEGGEEGEESVVGVGIAIPLLIRNNYEDQVRSARQNALAAKAGYRAVLRELRFAIQASTTVARQYRTQHERWSEMVADSGDLSANLLLRQWEEGDIGTNAYLLLLQQRIDGLLAGIQLTENYRLSLVNWLNTTGQVSAQLNHVEPTLASQVQED